MVRRRATVGFMSTCGGAGTRRRAWRLTQDVALAAAVIALGLIEVWAPLESAHGDGSPIVSSVGIVLAGLALMPRRTHPWAVLGVFAVWLAIGVLTLAHMQALFWGQIVPFMIALYSAARHGRGRVPWLAAMAAAVTLLFADLFIPLLQDWDEILFHWGVCTLAFAIGWGLRRSEERAIAAAIEAREIAIASDDRAAAAVRDERARIARELHDVLAHSVSVMVVQAGAAEQVLDADPERSRQAMAAIRETGNNSLDEVNRLVTLLREDDEGDLRPQPGLAAIGELVETAHVPGFDVRLTIDGDPASVPPGMGLAAYRIVQESLTNTRKHSNATTAEVTVAVLPDGVHIDVVDDGSPMSAGRMDGHGLIGMRERVALYDGTLDASSTPRGFRVRAILKRSTTA